MCKQPFVKCKNRTCDGIAQYHPFLPCDKRPNCPIEQVRVPAKRDTLVPYCPSCIGLTNKQREAQTAQARFEKAKAAEAQARARRAINSAQVGQAQAESSATGAYTGDARYLLGANPSNEPTYAPGFQYETTPEFGFPQFASSHAPASDFLPSENIPASVCPYGFPAYPASSPPGPGSDNPLSPPQGIASPSNPALELQYGTAPPFFPYPASSHAPASSFLLSPENAISPPQGTESPSNPVPGVQYGTEHQSAPQGTGAPFAGSSTPASGFQYGTDLPFPPYISPYSASSSNASASSFLPSSGNSFAPPQGTGFSHPSDPVPASQYGTVPQFPQQETGAPLTPPQGTAGFHFGTDLGSPPASPQFPIDPALLHANIIRDNGIDPDDREAVEQFLRPMGLWPDGFY